MVINYLKGLTESYKWIPEMIVILGAISLIFLRVRIWIMRFLRGFIVWVTFPFKSQDTRKSMLNEISLIRVELEKNTKISEETAKTVDSLKKTIGFNGGSGILDQIGRIEGYQKNEFWEKSQPGFICGDSGNIFEVTHGFCLLLGVSNKLDLGGIGWKSFLNKFDSSQYFLDFKEAVNTGTVFRSHINLFNVKGDTRGEWVIVARLISSEKAVAKRFIVFLYPLDEPAKKIAESYGWSTEVVL